MVRGNIKNILPLAISVSIVFLGFSCDSNNELSPNPLPAEKPLKVRTDTILSFRANPNPQDTVCGRGYDITEDLMGEQLFKGKVIDLTAYLEHPANKDKMVQSGSHYSYSFLYYGASVPVFLENMRGAEKMIPNSNNALEELLGDYLPFMKTFKNQKEWEHKALGLHVTKSIRRSLKFHDGPEAFKDFLTAEFTKDLEKCTPDELIEKYGTHVPLNMSMGGELSMLTGANFDPVQDSYEEENLLKAGALYRYSAFSQPRSASSPDGTNIDRYNRYSENEYLSIQLKGGLYKINASFAVDRYNVFPENENLWYWDPENPSLNYNHCMEISWDRCFPLSDFIADEIQKQDVKEAIRQYIAKSNQ